MSERAAKTAQARVPVLPKPSLDQITLFGRIYDFTIVTFAWAMGAAWWCWRFYRRRDSQLASLCDRDLLCRRRRGVLRWQKDASGLDNARRGSNVTGLEPPVRALF